jgi:hypothetical protein
MKRILSLLLSFTVGFLGVISMSAPAARAQTVASFSLSKLREQYEQLLAVERDPNTTPEVRERNHAFLEARRAQLADALRKRMDALRAYRASLATTLTDEEKSAVEVSIQQLADELQSLQPPDTPPAEETRPAPSKAAQRKRLVPATYENGTKKELESSNVTAAAAAGQAAAIEITYPDKDTTVHVSEIELQVALNDPDINELMVAVYTPASTKPFTARVYQLERIDRDKKSVPIALKKGQNRIEVSDNSRPNIKTVRTLTYSPVTSILGGAIMPAGVTTTDEATDTTKVVLCGQVSLASLSQTFSFIKNTPLKDPDDSSRELRSRFNVDDATDSNYFLRHSRLDDNCVEQNVEQGAQKNAVVNLLRAAAKQMELSKEKVDPEFSGVSSELLRKQANLLEEYLGNVKVQIKKDGNVVATPLLDKDGNYKVTLDAEGTYVISTEGDDYYTQREVVLKNGATRVNINIEDRPVSLLARAIVGREQSGASSAQNQQNYFFDLFISKTLPLRQKISPNFGERWRTWGDFRIASTPLSDDTTIGAISTGFATQISQIKVRDAARVFEFLGGLEYRVTGNAALLPSFDRQTKQKFSLSFIAGFGGITPINPQDSITTFKVFDDAPGLPPEAKGKEFVAFIPADRSHFFRQYYLGARIQTFFFNRYNVPIQRFPAQLDLTVGQNEFVTGGKLHGPIMRIEGFFPLPYEDLKFINLFATAMLRPGGERTTTPLVLQPAPDGTVVPASNVVLVTRPQPNRDYYRIGAGIDLVSFYQWFKQATSSGKSGGGSAPVATPSPTTSPTP